MSGDGVARIEAACGIIAALDGCWPTLDVFRQGHPEHEWVISYQYENTEPLSWRAATLDGAIRLFLTEQVKRADDVALALSEPLALAVETAT